METEPKHDSFETETWLRFEDSTGWYWAQPDYYIVYPSYVVLFECKLSQVKRAWPQMLELYKQRLERIYGLPVACVQGCKRLRYADEGIVSHIKELKYGSTWHWLGDRI